VEDGAIVVRDEEALFDGIDVVGIDDLYALGSKSLAYQTDAGKELGGCISGLAAGRCHAPIVQPATPTCQRPKPM